MTRRIRVGTRCSALARAQTEWVIARLQQVHCDLPVETRIIKTLADRVQDVPLHGFRERGVFVKEIEKALLDGEIDLAVHSMKDLPSDLPAGLVIGAVPPREEALDVLVVRDAAGSGASGPLPLPPGAVVGTSSLRRRAQLLHHRRDLRTVDLRGNVETRLRKLDAGEMDAIVLAAAGLNRLGLAERITCRLPEALVLPAVCQGALAIQCRADDAWLLERLAVLEDPATRLCVRAERALLAAMGGGCAVPIGALARVKADCLTLSGVVATPDGDCLHRDAATGSPDDPEELGRRLGERLLAAGGRQILDSMRLPHG
jgi:hydroxymethylbilane synthase